MNWFKRHLNWTLIFAYAAGILAVFLLTSIGEGAATFGVFLCIAWVLGVSGWFLSQKGRSLWNICWLFLGWIGFIVLLCLANKKNLIELPSNIHPWADRKEEE